MESVVQVSVIIAAIASVAIAVLLYLLYSNLGTRLDSNVTASLEETKLIRTSTESVLLRLGEIGQTLNKVLTEMDTVNVNIDDRLVQISASLSDVIGSSSRSIEAQLANASGSTASSIAQLNSTVVSKLDQSIAAITEVNNTDKDILGRHGMQLNAVLKALEELRASLEQSVSF